MEIRDREGAIATMMSGTMRGFARVLSASILLFLSAFGCAGGPEVRGRYFFPPPPDEPRLELVKIYMSQYDFPPRSGFARWKDKVLGRGGAPMLFKKPVGIASDGKGKVYVTDPNQSTVFIYDLENYRIDTLGEPGLFQTPVGVAVDARGRVYVTDTGGGRNTIVVFGEGGGPLFSFGQGKVNWPTGVAVDDERGRVYVVNSHGHNVTVFDTKGRYLFTIGKRGRGNGSFNFPTGVAVNSRGEVIVADSINALIQIFSPEGEFLHQFGRRGDGPMDFEIIKDVAVDSEDHIYVTDSKASKLMIFTDRGRPLLSFNGRFHVPKGKEGPIHSGLTLPSGIDIDDNNTIYIADSWNRRFQVYQYLDDKYLAENPIEEEK